MYEEKIDQVVSAIMYQDVDVNLSDHKPVCGVFEVRVKRVEDKEKYGKQFEHEKRLYYVQKEKVLNAKDASGRVGGVKSQANEIKSRKNSSNEIDFFCEKQLQASKEQLLIELQPTKPSQQVSPTKKS